MLSTSGGENAKTPPSGQLWASIERSARLAEEWQHEHVTPLHLLFSLFEDGDTDVIFEVYDVDVPATKAEIKRQLDLTVKNIKLHGREQSGLSTEIITILTGADIAAARTGRKEVDSNFALAAMLADENGYISRILGRYELSLSGVLEYLNIGSAEDIRIKPEDLHDSIKAAESRVASGKEAAASETAKTEDNSRTDTKDGNGNANTRAAKVIRLPSAGSRPIIFEKEKPQSSQQDNRPIKTTNAKLPEMAKADTGDPPHIKPHAKKEPPKPEERGAVKIPPTIPTAQKNIHTAEEQGKQAPATPKPSYPGPENTASNGLQTAPPSPAALADAGSYAGNSLPLDTYGAGRNTVPDTNAVSLLESGTLSYSIPRKMRLGSSYQISVQIKPADNPDILTDRSPNIPVVTEATTIQLRSPGSGFHIENLSPDTQWIDSEHRHAYGDKHKDIWHWVITPTSRGHKRLRMVFSARTINIAGEVRESRLPDRVYKIKVKRNLKTLALRTVLGIAGAIIAVTLGVLVAKYGHALYALVTNIPTNG
jgi:hypothetical protein